MKRLSIKEILYATSGKTNYKSIEDTFIDNICTDTRSITNDKSLTLFIPLKGENFDGHNYIHTAFQKGINFSLSEKKFNNELDEYLIIVEDTKKALADLAKYYISKFKYISTIGITGSVGKTTTKDIVASVLSQKYNILKTEGNFNNEIGLPLTIFNITDDTEIIVLEMGMNNFGEIHNLSEIVNPDIAIITNIGFSHIENLGDRNGILKAKCEIFDFLNINGFGVLNGDDDMLLKLKDNEKMIYFGIEKNDLNHFFATNIIENGLNGISFNINTPKNNFFVELKVPGRHMIYNALVATVIGQCFEIPREKIKIGIENFKSSKMRSNIINTEKYTIIDDVYNASPTSMKASIDILSSINGRKVAILGDMLELGEYSIQFHREIGEYVSKRNIDILVAVGKFSEYIKIGANKENLQVFYFENQDLLLNQIENIIQHGDIILVKASRGMKLEKTIDKIKR